MRFRRKIVSNEIFEKQKRCRGYLKSQRVDFYFYVEEFTLSELAKEEFDKSKIKYRDRVKKLNELVQSNPQTDCISDKYRKTNSHNPDSNRIEDIYDINKYLNSFDYKDFNVPETTHRRSDYDDENGVYEGWSKDIDEKNRLIYRIDTIGIGKIQIISISGHDFDIKKHSAPFSSKIDKRLDKLL